jgi:asparagine synthase (glutamine-hydrolysing)
LSVQFGFVNLDGGPLDSGRLRLATSLLAPYAPSGLTTSAAQDGFVLLGLLPTQGPPNEKLAPRQLRGGQVLTWIGRLDNRLELLHQLSPSVEGNSPDKDIVAAAYEQLGAKCLPRILGDWALSLWDPGQRTLTLAKDFLGSVPLFCLHTENVVAWSSVLGPLLALLDGEPSLDLEYLAGWLSLYPATDRSPYAAIHSVPPASILTIRGRVVERTTFWNFDGTGTIRYRSDRDYEEHFRVLLAQAIRRRLRSASPILAELSGGMDSSSVVCMADRLFARGEAETPRIDTVSFYTDSEADWDEQTFFTEVEQQRGAKGFHIRLDPEAIFRLDSPSCPSPVPGSEFRDRKAIRQLEQYILAQGHRVVLSGLGGDEVLGGVPTPFPELEDLLARGHFLDLAHSLKVWALTQRKPWIHLLLESARGFLPSFLARVPPGRQSASWLCDEFLRCHRAAVAGYPARLRLFGPFPSFQENEATLEVLRRQIGCMPLPAHPPHEKRYPLLDRDLVSFLFAIPREQLVRPRQRRSLLRRALRGIVPDAVLDRKRKGFVSSSPLRQFSRNWARLVAFTTEMRASSLGIVDPARFRDAFERAREGREVSLPLLLRTLSLELWLQNRASGHAVPSESNPGTHTSSTRNIFSAEKIRKERRLTP